MKVTRIITYEGSEEAVLKALAQSRPDGVLKSGWDKTDIVMSILTVGNKSLLEAYKTVEEKKFNFTEWFKRYKAALLWNVK